MEGGPPKPEEEKQGDDQSDYDDEDMDEMGDQIQELGAKTDMMNLGSNIGGAAGKPVKATQSFQVPKGNVGMGGIPKAPSGSKPFADPMAKFQPQSWNEFFDHREMLDDKIPVYHAGTEGHVFFCLHGAGHTALSFAALARIIKSEQYNGTLVSFDFRGHGGHYHENETVMSQEELILETIHVLKYAITKYPAQSIILVGHSMGGAIAAKTIDYIQKNHAEEEWKDHVKGLFIIDVVEGSAMDALPFMEDIVKNRPAQFSDIPNVVKYGYQSMTVRDIKSARVSMPDQVVEKTDEHGNKVYVWRTNLLASKQYWIEWFKGLTQIFLDLKIPKQLLLAASDRMDKELTIAHMQGKFKMVVVDNVGHVVQEDNPVEVARKFQMFLGEFHIPPLYKEQMVITTISGKKVVINK